jgi:hypothetical protein
MPRDRFFFFTFWKRWEIDWNKTVYVGSDYYVIVKYIPDWTNNNADRPFQFSRVVTLLFYTIHDLMNLLNLLNFLQIFESISLMFVKLSKTIFAMSSTWHKTQTFESNWETRLSVHSENLLIELRLSSNSISLKISWWFSFPDIGSSPSANLDIQNWKNLHFDLHMLDRFLPWILLPNTITCDMSYLFRIHHPKSSTPAIP